MGGDGYDDLVFAPFLDLLYSETTTQKNKLEIFDVL